MQTMSFKNGSNLKLRRSNWMLSYVQLSEHAVKRSSLRLLLVSTIMETALGQRLGSTSTRWID